MNNNNTQQPAKAQQILIFVIGFMALFFITGALYSGFTGKKGWLLAE